MASPKPNVWSDECGTQFCLPSNAGCVFHHTLWQPAGREQCLGTAECRLQMQTLCDKSFLERVCDEGGNDTGVRITEEIGEIDCLGHVLVLRCPGAWDKRPNLPLHLNCTGFGLRESRIKLIANLVPNRENKDIIY